MVAGEDVLLNGYDAEEVPAEAVSETLTLPDPPAPVQQQRNSLLPIGRGELMTGANSMRRHQAQERTRAARQASRGRGRGRGGRGRGRGATQVDGTSDQVSASNMSCIMC